MAFKPYKGKFKVIQLPVTTSTTITKDGIVSFSSGLLIKATSSTTNLSHAGVAIKAVAATDTDYATARSIGVLVPVEKFSEFIADVTATLVVGDVGLEVDLTDDSTLNRAASSVDVAMIKDFISTTKCTCWLKLLGSY